MSVRPGLPVSYQEPFPPVVVAPERSIITRRGRAVPGSPLKRAPGGALELQIRQRPTESSRPNGGSSAWPGDTVALVGWPVVDDRLTFVSDRGDHGRRLDLVLLRHLAGLPGLSRTRLQALIQTGGVEVGGRSWTRAAQRIPAGTRVRVSLPEGVRRRQGVVAEDIPLEILHEDDWLLVINKPPGLIVHPSYGHRAGTLINALVHYARAWPGGRPSLVHRLDKFTSGALIVAKSREVHASCARALGDPDSRKDTLRSATGACARRRAGFGRPSDAIRRTDAGSSHDLTA